MALYNRCIACLLYFVLLIISSDVFAVDYYKHDKITYTQTSIVAISQLTDFTTKRPVEDFSKKATVNFSDEVISKIGKTVKSRIFENSYSKRNSAVYEQFLKSLGYIVDHEKKQIKKPLSDMSCRNFGVEWKVGTSSYKCPSQAYDNYNICLTNQTAKSCKQATYWTDQYHTKKLEDWTSENPPPEIHIEVHYTYNGNDGINYIIVRPGDKIFTDYQVLTDKEVGDIFLNNKKYIEDIFTADNEFEVTANLAYLELHYAMQGSSNQVSPDSSIKPDVDPETGQSTGGFNLPSFCDWAKPLCDFFTWMKETVTEPTDTKVDTNHELSDMQSPEQKDYLNFQKQCPAPISENLQILGMQWEFSFSFDFLCTYLIKFSGWLLGFSYFAGAMIIAGVRNA